MSSTIDDRLKENAFIKHYFLLNDLMFYDKTTEQTLQGAQGLSGRVLVLRPRAAGSSLTGVTVLRSLSKTHLS